MPVARVLGVDLGSRRIGLAIADAGIGIARPLATVGRGGAVADDAEAIGRVCREQGVVELVVGLPVTLRDERLSSYEAERRLGRMPRGRSGGPPSRTQRNAFRARIDREAAAIILQDELDARLAARTPAVGAAGGAEDGR